MKITTIEILRPVFIASRLRVRGEIIEVDAALASELIGASKAVVATKKEPVTKPKTKTEE